MIFCLIRAFIEMSTELLKQKPATMLLKDNIIYRCAGQRPSMTPHLITTDVILEVNRSRIKISECVFKPKGRGELGGHLDDDVVR